MRPNPRTSRILTFLLLTATLTAAAPAWAAASEKDLDRSIDFKVTEADSGEVFKTFGQIMGAEVAVDPSLTGRKLTLQLENVRLRTVLGAVCESLGCQWTYTEGPPAKLAFKAGGAPSAKSGEAGAKAGLDADVDIHLTGANAVEVLRTVAELLSAEANIDPKVAGKIDLDLKQVPVRSVLTKICDQIGCNWTVVEGEKPLLRVVSAK